MNNPELDLAWQFVNNTDRNIFLTGKAGTGKTTFLHQVKTQTMKRIAVVAPTGVAAINAKGVTIHSFFQMPFGPILPEGEEQNIKREFKRKFNRTKIDIIKSLDLLVIDEISMVRADLLDGIDQVLRKYKNRSKVFGGVQVLLIGDLQQLAPVVKENEWAILQKYYKTPYFFSSKAFIEANPVNIELKHIYRQQNEDFIHILNEIRENKLSEKSAELLNKRYLPDFKPKKGDDYIILTTHNYKADRINQERLGELSGKKHSFDAYIDGYFPENAYPNDERLVLKEGAQVMFIKNDSHPDKRYFNGKIGRVTDISDKQIMVQCPGDELEIEVNRETWDNITYEINPETNAIEEKIKGSYAQIPLRLAWAITIHKSQGLTFEKAIIDTELSFAHGQTYVALSRCKTLEGMVLRSPVKPQSIINDTRVTSFTDTVAAQQPDEADLKASQKQFFLNLVNEMLDYYPALFPVNRMLDIYYKNTNTVKGNLSEMLTNIKDAGIMPLLKVKNAFNKQLVEMAENIDNPEQNAQIQERVLKAVNYFLQQTELHIEKAFNELNFTTDNKQIDKDINKHLNKFEEWLTQKLLILKGIQNSFKIADYLKLRADAALLKQPKKRKKSIIKLTEHNDLFDALRELRSEFSFNEDIPPYQVFTQETLFELCEKLPVTSKQLKKIHGIGKVRLRNYGEAILEIIQAYCISNNIELKEDEPEIIKAPKGQTKQISLQHFKDGKTPEQIAKERELTPNTIYNHLVSFIPSGEISASDLIPEPRLSQMLDAIKKTSYEGTADLKQKTGDKYDWWELRLGIGLLNS